MPLSTVSQWPSIYLRDCGTWHSGGTPSTAEPSFWNGDIPWITASSLQHFDITDSERRLTVLGVRSGSRLVPKDTVLFVVRGMSLKKEFRVGIARRPVAFGQDCKAIITDGKIDPEYLAYTLKAKSFEILSLVDEAGHGTGRLQTGLLEEVEIPLPPLEEQHKIAAILSTWDEAIRLTADLIAAKQQRKNGLMQRLLSGEVRFADINSRENGIQQANDEWVEKTILDLGKGNPKTVQTGPFGAQLHASDYVSSGIPIILIRNIDENGLKADGIPKISLQDAERLKRYSIEENDIVFSRVGRVGSCFLATRDQQGWIISGQTLRIRLPKDTIDFRFLNYALRGERVQSYLRGTTIGTTRQSISTKVLEELPILVPSMHEQKRIGEVLELCDQEVELLRQKRAALQQQKKGLMQQLLTGRIRVTSDERRTDLLTH